MLISERHLLFDAAVCSLLSSACYAHNSRNLTYFFLGASAAHHVHAGFWLSSCFFSWYLFVRLLDLGAIACSYHSKIWCVQGHDFGLAL
ncbi:hypothetical protein DUNSADRAFT_3908 [Dunaliella salina]|uniref:Secreted protein n=1 Tax=Dunaliella salina TaxID=3046 RepID=A0ABQ7GT47_DUNSA|nr:hypothetical protein DUNSADRAFT_3908 [Dunaliella salina]|eukprot:KAF5837765.1 hypothetical protein DUNSADRAFT_3908 [Dunaliella salina]